MADSAALKLGNIISSSVSGSMQALTSGIKGSLSQGAGFSTMSSALSKGLSRIDKTERDKEKRRSEEASRDRGFAEERDNEKKKFDAIFMAVTKGMAINVDKIQKDVSEILNLMKEKQNTSIMDMLKGLLSGLGAGAAKFIDEIGKALKGIVGRIGTAMDDIIRFFKNIPNALSDVFKFLKNLPSRFASMFDNIIDALKALPTRMMDFFKPLMAMFDNFVNKYFPHTKAAITKFFTDLADILKLDKLKAFFSSQLDKLKNLFKFDDIFKAIGSKLNDLVKLLGEGDIAKAFRRIRNVFAISFAQYADEMEDLFSNKLMKSLGDIKNNIGGLGKRIMDTLDGVVDSLKSSGLSQFGNEFSGKIMTFFDETIAAAKTSKMGTLAADIMDVGIGLYKDIGTMLKSGLGSITPNLDDLKTFFTLGKDAINLDELKFVMGEGGVFQKGATLIGKFVGDMGAIFKPILDFFTGNNLLGQIAGFDEITKIFGTFGKLIGGIIKNGLRAVPVIGWIITAIEGLLSAFNTEQIAEDLGKEADKVSFKDRIVAGLAGAIASIPGGIIDLVRMAVNALFDTDLETSGPDSVQGRLTSYLTKALSDLGSLIGSTFSLLIGLITFDKEAMGTASADISRVFDSMIKDLGDIFTRYITLPAKNIYNSAIGFVEGITNWLIDGMNKLMAAAIDAIPSRFVTRFGTIELISEETKSGWKEKLSMGKVDMSSSKLDVSKDQARIDELDKTRLESRKRIEQEVADKKRIGQQAAVPPAAAAGAPQSGTGNSYTEADLKSLGLNIKGGGVTQTSGATISPMTISGAQWVQGNVSGVRFTGFNDQYHTEKSPRSSHTKGLAFDMTIPPDLAQNNTSRQSIAKSISTATGAWVKDEYAEPTAKSTGGHFHVDFSKAKGVDNGQGNFGGGSPPPKYVPLAADTSSFMGPQQDSGLMGPIQDNGVAGTGLRSPYAQQQTQALNGILNTVKDQYSLSTGTRNLSRDQLEEARRQTELYRNVDEYQQERDKLQEEFNSELKGIFSPLVKGLLGPAGEGRREDERRAGRNITGTFLSSDFEKLGKKIFGSQQGAAIGETFQKLAGVYLDQFIDKALAPALGMDSKYLNRSINTFLEGYKQTQPEIKRLEKEIEKTKTELKTYQVEKGVITSADIIRAGGRKGFTAEEQANLTEINRLNEIIRVNQEQLDKTKAVRKEYKTAAIGDLVYGMTGVAITPRNVLEDIYGNRGSEGLVEDLASIFGAPVAGLFKASPVGTDAASKEVEMRRQLTTEQVAQTRAVNTENIQAHSQLQQNVLTAQGGLFEKLLNGMSSVFTSGADMFKGALGSIGISGGAAGGGNILERLGGDVVKDAVKDAVKDIAGNKPSGTAIPGGMFPAFNTETGETYYTDIPTAPSGRFVGPPEPFMGPPAPSSGGFGMGNISLGSIGSSAMGRVGSFASKSLDNFITSKISNSLGGGFSGQIGGSLIAGFGKSLFSGGNFNFAQALGNSFGLKLGPGASMTDFMSGFKNMGGSMMMNMGGTIANLGANMGSQFVTELGAGMAQSGAGVAFGSAGTGTMQIGQALGEVGGILGPAMMSYNLSKMIGGEYKTGLPVNEIAAIASYFVGPIAGVIGGLVNRAFGRGPKKVKASRVVGDLKYDASNLRTEQDWKQKGGWFRSSRSGTDVKQFTAEETDAVNDAIASVYDSLKTVTEGLKLDISSAYNFSKSIRLDMTKLTPEQQQKKWEEVFQQFNDEMYRFTFGASLEAARNIITDQSGNEVLESYEQTLIRLTQVDQLFNATMRSVLEISGKSIETMFTRLTGQLDNATKIFVADMKDAYVEAFGGIQELNRVQTEYINLFYTDEEKAQQGIRDANTAITEALKDTTISASQFTQGFGTVAELQAIDQETFMESQRTRYRTMVEDFEKTYGWMLTSTEENVREYGRLEKGIKDAGSDFLTAAQLTYQSANALKEGDAAIVVTNTERTVGTGSGPAGELMGSFASGGKYKSGKGFLVGEVGPELMIPNFSGTIVPTHKIIEAVQNASSLDSKTRKLLTSATPDTNSVANAYMLQQAMNNAMSAEKEIRASINNNNSMVNQTVNNVSSPQTNIVSSGTGGVRSDNPMMNSFSRSSTRPRSF